MTLQTARDRAAAAEAKVGELEAALAEVRKEVVKVHCDKRWGYHGNPHDFFAVIHATAAQKIAALAKALRSEVKNAE